MEGVVTDILGKVSFGSLITGKRMCGSDMCGMFQRGKRMAGIRNALTDVINALTLLSAHARNNLGEMPCVRFGRPGLRTTAGLFWLSGILRFAARDMCITAFCVYCVSFEPIHMALVTIARSALPIAISERIMNKTNWVMGERRGFSDDVGLRRVIAPFFISRL